MLRSRSPRLLRAAVLAAALGAGVLTACGGPGADDAARTFLAAWQRGDYAAAARLTTATQPKAVAAALREDVRGLSAERLRFTLGEVRDAGDEQAHASFRASMRLGTLDVAWSYRGGFGLRESDGAWRVVWAPPVVHPALGKGDRLIVTRTQPSRGPILDRDGARLMLNEDVVVVGVVPEAMKHRAHTLRVLAREVGIDAKENAARIAKAVPNGFVPLITLREADYLRVKPAIHDLPGVRFRTESRPLAKTRAYARQVLGTVGPISAEQLKQLGAPYVATDLVGTYGIQAAYERRLAGVPNGEVQVVDHRGAPVKRLARFAGRDGQPVHTTLDERVQDAAERALDTVSEPAALVAVQASTGQLLAVANRPVDDSFDRALVGRYPPGSTFKVVTTTALLDRTDLHPTTPVPCPSTIRAGGRTFGNFEGEAAGRPSFRTDFAISCNTAFIRLSRSLPGDALADAARSYGFGSEYALGLPAYSGQVPATRAGVDKAAETIGQGKVLASPLTMALVAATVRSGAWHPPALVTEPRPDASGAEPVRLDRSDARTLRSLMRSVVTSGTGQGIDLPGEPVAGKTGTAEYGSGDPPPTHAWFIGYRGDVAFSVIVEGGGVGAEAAVPVARTFLEQL